MDNAAYELKILENNFSPVTNERVLHLSLSYSAQLSWWGRCLPFGSTVYVSPLNSLTYMMVDQSSYLTAPCYYVCKQPPK